MFRDLMLEVWREACRHIEIDVSLDRIALLLAPVLPADYLLVRRVDVSRALLETVTAGVCRPDVSPPALVRSPCDPGQLGTLVDWCRDRAVRLGRPSDDPVLGLVVPSDVGSACLAGGLVTDSGPVGVLAAVRANGTFTGEQTHLFHELLEPVAVALANDWRLHELARLREALEADKRALLTRLGRRDLTDTIVGADAGLRTVLERVEQVAPTDVPVLLFGATGTGKEVVARAIHSRSARASGPIMRVNCGALPAGLIDSELFGHERGSFTGAVAMRQGWFERADGGTLFLDEIGELPLEAQVRLLRIVQDGTYERVGGHKSLKADVRVIAATHRDLQDMVARGTFREDLWYRLSVFPIRIPPLRERLDDIPPLATHFAARTGIRLGGRPLAPTSADLALLTAYDWPGNVRELAAVIERAAILGDGRALRLAAALGTPAPPTPRPSRSAAPSPVGPEAPASTDTLNEAMIRHIERALIEAHGRIEGPFGAAARLGINPHTLRGRMRKLGVDWRRFRRGGSQTAVS